MKTSLLTETLDVLLTIGYNKNNVEYVGTYDGTYSLTWKEFAEQADKINYRYNNPKINDFIIMFKDKNWLEGNWIEPYFTEDDNYRGLVWKLIEQPKVPHNAKPLKLVRKD